MVAPWLYKLFLRATRVSSRRFFLPTSWRRQILWFQELEQRITPTFTGGVNVAAGDINGDRFADIVTGPGAGIPAQIRAVSGHDGADLLSVFPFDSTFATGIQVAVGDVNGDQAADILVGAGNGGAPRIQVLNGRDGEPIQDFFAYEDTFRGGVQVTTGDVNGDGFSDIIAGAGIGGGPRVRVFSGKDGAILEDFFAYEDTFRGGVFVAAGDVNGDGSVDIITGAGFGGGPRVRVFSGKDNSVISDFFAYEDTFRGGVTVSSGDIDGDGYADSVVGAGPGGGPRVRVLSGKTGGTLYDDFAYESSFRGGVSVTTADLNADGRDDLIFGAGGGGGPRVRAVDVASGTTLADYFAYDPQTNPGGFSQQQGPDTTAPSITIAAPAAITNTNPVISGKVTDNRAGVVAEVKTDNSLYTPVSIPAGGGFTYTTKFALDGTADGSHQLTFRGRDRAGNQSQEKTVGFTLDTIAPNVTLQLDSASDTAPLGDNKTSLHQVALFGKSEPGLMIRLGADGPAVTADTNGTFRFNSVALAIGVNPFNALATDAAGNVGKGTLSITRITAPTVPTVTAGLANDTAPGGGPNNDLITFDPAITGVALAPSGLIDVKASVGTSGAFVSILADVTPDGKYTLNLARLEQLAGTALLDGPITVRVQAFGALGLASEIAVVNLTLDRVAPPLPTITLPGGILVTTADMANLVGKNEPGAFLRLGSSGTLISTAADGSFIFQDVPLVSGANSFAVTAFDVAGNMTTASTVIQRVTTTGPTLTPTLDAASNTGRNPATNLTKFNTPTVQVSAPPGEAVEFFADGVSVGTAVVSAGVARFGLPTQTEGMHTITARRIAGQMSNPLTITVDSVAPSAVTLTLSVGSQAGDPLTTNAAFVNLVGVTERNSLVKLVGPALSGLSSATGSFTLANIPLSLGANQFTVSVTDEAGNVSTFTPAAITRLASAAQQDAVTTWITVALQAVQGDASTPPIATRSLAMTSGAMFDAVSAIEGRPGYFVTRTAAPGTSLPTAVAVAAHRVLSYLYPVQQATFDAQLALSLASVTNGQSKDDGTALGQSIATAIITQRQTDGYDRFVTYSTNSAPGAYVATAPNFAEPLLANWGQVDPFTIDSGNQYRPAAPPALTSAEYTAALNEVKQIGRRDSTTRTADQTQIARFWADGAGTDTPAGHWLQIAFNAAQARGNSLAANARLFAELSLAMADSAIAAWDVKYEYGLWRPITAIQLAAEDGNPDTTADADWLPLITTPPFPEYVSGHSTFSAAAAEILSASFGDNYAFSGQSVGFPGVTRSFPSFRAAAIEAGRSRVYGGIHYEFSNQAGQQLGRNVATRVMDVFNLSQDTIAPKLTVVTVDGPSTKVNPSVAGRVRDFVSGVEMVTAKTDNGTTFPVPVDADGNMMFTPQLPTDGTADGAHTVTFTAIDFSGNRSTKVFHFTLATRGPIVTLNTPTLAADLFPSATATGTVDFGAAPLASFSYQLDAGAKYTITATSTGAFDQFVNLSRVTAGNHTLTVTAADAAGNVNTVTRAVTMSKVIPFVVTGINPADGAEDVGTTYRPVVYFSRPADLGTLNADTIWATDSSGVRLQAKVVPADDGTFAWLFFDAPLPGASRITVHASGAKITAFDGAILDGDGDGVSGGELEFGFSTVSLASVPGTIVSGVLLDPGPDLKPFTTDDTRAGPDGSLMTADDKYLLPISGATISILGRPDLTTLTGTNGSFTLANTPAGSVKFVINGRTAKNAPSGFYFPEMVMDLTLDPGVVNTVMGSMGTDQQKAASAKIPAVHIPRVRSAVLTAVTKGQPDAVTITTNAESSQGLTPSQRQELTIQVNGNSMLGADGRLLDGAQIGISTVDPSLVRDMLPPGVLQHTFDITVQAPGVDRFATPAPMTFPNTFNAIPGTKLDFLSFDHTTGMLVIEGTATVSADGKSVSTDPGTGVTHPGWHGLTPPGGCNKGSPPAPPPPPPMPKNTLDEKAHSEMFISGDSGLSLNRSWSLAKNPTDPPPPPPLPNGCPPPKKENNKKTQLNVKIEVDGPVAKFLKKDAGATEAITGASFTVKPGDKEHVFAVTAKSFVEMLGTNGVGEINRDQLYGSKIKITEKTTKEDGSTDTKISVYRLYRWVDAVDAYAAAGTGNDDTAAFFRTFVGITRTKNVDLFVPGADNMAFKGSDSQFDYSNAQSWSFTPTAVGRKLDEIRVEVTDPKHGKLSFGSIDVTGQATAATTVSVNTGKFATELVQTIGLLGTDATGVFYPHSATSHRNLSPLMLTEFAGFLPSDKRPDGTYKGGDVNVFAASMGTKLFNTVKSRYNFLGSAISVVADNSGDIKMDWKELGGGLFGRASYDGPNPGDTFETMMKNPKVGQAAQQWLLADTINKYTNNLIGEFAVGINYDATNTEFADFVGNTVCHEIAHTFGLNDLYLSGPGGVGVAQNFYPFDIMMGGTGSDPRLVFGADNSVVFQASLGKQSNGDLPITNALKFYRSHFYLPGNAKGLRDQGELTATPHVVILDQGAAIDKGTVITVGDQVLTGSKSTTVVGLSNAGTADLVITGAQIAANSAAFTLVNSPAFLVTLPPGAELSLTAAYSPTSVGVGNGTITVSTNDPTWPDATIPLTGSALANSAIATFAIANNNFGGALLGQTVSGQSVATITNDGGQPLSITGVTIVDGQGFTLTGVPVGISTNPIVVAPGESFTFGGTFTADALGIRRGKVQITTNDPTHSSFSVGLVGTGLDSVVYPAWGADYIGVDDGAGGFAVRTKSDATGNFSVFLPSERDYRIVVFDPVTGLVGTGHGRTLPSGQGSDLTESLVFAASTAPDTDGDGLPDDVEFAIGSGVKNPDSNRDQIDDYSAIQQGLNPLGDPLPIGVLASLPLQGTAKAIALTGSAVDSDGQTAYIATGDAGLAIVNATKFANPVVLAQLDLPGESNDVAVDASRGVVVLAAGFPGVNFVDVTDPANPILTRTVATPYATSAVEVYDGVVYAANGRTITALDIRSGEFIETLTLSGTVIDLAREGSFLYALDTASRVRVIDLSEFSMVQRGVVTVGVGNKLSVGNGIGYVATGTTSGGFSTVDLTNPFSPVLISGPDVGSGMANSGTMIVPNGSGVGVAVGGNDFVFGGFKGLDLFDISDLSNTGKFATRIPLPSTPTALALGAGIAYVAAGTGGLQVVNYLPFDAEGQAPTVKVSTPGTAGPTVVAGTSISVLANVTDDTQVRNVELLVNGKVVANNVALPYDFTATVPAFVPAGPNPFTLVVRATDTGGNVAVSTPISYSVIADVAPPTAIGSSPSEGASVYYTPQVDIRFDKPLDAATLTAGGVVLSALDAGGQPISTVPISKVDLLSRGRRVAVYPVNALATGNYSLTISKEAIRSRAGVDATSPAVLTFSVRTASNLRAASGVPTIPNAPAANPLQNIDLIVPWEPSLTRAVFDTNTGTPGQTTVYPTSVNPAAGKATVTVPDYAATGDLVVYGSYGYDVTRLPNWAVTQGTVDVYGKDSAGNVGFDPQPGRGLYINLASNTDQLPRLESKADFSLPAGDYTFSFDIAGSTVAQQKVAVSFGGAYSETFTVAANAPFSTINRTITLPSNTLGKLSFEVTEGVTSYSGPLLDNVKLVSVATGKAYLNDRFDQSLPENTIPLQIVPVLESGYINTGGAYRGNTLYLSGHGFIPGQTTINIGGLLVSPTYNSYNNSVYVTVPTGAPTGPINIITDGGTSVAFQQRFEGITALPVSGTAKDNISPAANPGQAITLNGSGFDTQTSIIFRVDFGSNGSQTEYVVRPEAVSADGSSAVVIVPDGAVSGVVEVVGDQLAAAIPLQIVPVVKSAVLNSISGGVANYTLFGNGFVEDNSTYTFGSTSVIDTGNQADVYYGSVSINVPIAAGITGAISVSSNGGISTPFSFGTLSAVGTALSGTPADAAIASANPGQTVTLTGGKFDTSSYLQATYLSGGGNTAVRALYPQALAPDGSSANYQIPVDLGGVVTLSLAGAADDVPIQVVPFVTQVTGSPGQNITISGRGFIDDVPSNYDIGGIKVAEPSTDISAYWYTTSFSNLGSYDPSGTLVVHTAAGSSAPVPVAGVPVTGTPTLTAVQSTAAVGTAANTLVAGANTDQVITVIGTNLTFATTVQFPTRDNQGNPGFATALPLAVAADGQSATVRVPDNAATGAVAIVSGTGTATLQIVPTITSLSGRPSHGSFNINGSGFMFEQLTLKIGGETKITPTLDQTSSTVGGTNSVIYGINAGFVLDGDVTVTTDGGSVTLPATAYPPPTFIEYTSLAAIATRGTPANSTALAANPGQSIVLTGRAFTSSTVVLFTAQDAVGTVGVVSTTGTVSADRTKLTVTVPGLATTGVVRVVGVAGAGIPLQVVPVIRAIGGSITPGSRITLDGAGLLTNDLVVTVDGIPAAIVPGSGTTISELTVSQQLLSVVVPTGATAGRVVVRTAGGTAEGIFAGKIATAPNRVLTFDAGATLGSATEVLIAADTSITLTGGSVLTPSDVDIYRIPMSGGDRLYVHTTPTDTNLLGTSLRLFDSNGKAISFSYTFTTLDWVEVPTAGVYYLGVAGTNNYSYDPLVAGSGTGQFSSAGGYDIQITRQASGTSTLTAITAGSISGTAARAGTVAANVGQSVTLTGSGFTTNDRVLFTAQYGYYYYGTPYLTEYTAYPTSVAADGKSMTVVVPNGAVTGRVRLARETAGITLQIVPIITDLDQGVGDRFRTGSLNVIGSGFSQGHSVVGFSNSSRSGLDYYSNGNNLSVTVPRNAKSGPITLTTPGGTSATFGLSFTGISTLVPTTGTSANSALPAANPGQAVTLLGVGFDITTDVVFRVQPYDAKPYEYVVRPIAVAPDGSSAVVVVPDNAVTAVIEVVGDRLATQQMLQVVPVVKAARFTNTGTNATLELTTNGTDEDATTYKVGTVTVVDTGSQADKVDRLTYVYVPLPNTLAGPIVVTTLGGTSAPFTVGTINAVGTAYSGTPAGLGASANPGQSVIISGSKFTTSTLVSAEYPSGPNDLLRRILAPTWVASDGNSAAFDVPTDAGGIMTVTVAGAVNAVTVQIVPVVTQVSGSPGASLTISGRGFVDDPTSTYDVGGVTISDTSNSQQTYANTVYLYSLPAYNAAGSLVVHTAGGTSAAVPVAGVTAPGSATLSTINATAAFGTPAGLGAATNVAEVIDIVGTNLTLDTQITFPLRDGGGRVGSTNVTVLAVSANGTVAQVRVPGTSTTGAVRPVGGTGSALLQIVPTLTDITGRPGDGFFTLVGSGFQRGDTTISVGGLTVLDPVLAASTAYVYGVNNDQYVNLSASHALSGPIVVTTPGGSVTLAGPTYAVPAFVEFSGITSTVKRGTATNPAVPGVNVTDTIVLTGRGLNSTTTVLFTARDTANTTGTIAVIGNANSDGTQLTVVVPDSAVTGLVQVVGDAGPGGTLQIVPIIRSAGGLLTPGSTLTVDGSGLVAGDLVVLVDGIPATVSGVRKVGYLGQDLIDVVVPVGALAPTITVTTGGGTATYRWASAPPVQQPDVPLTGDPGSKLSTATLLSVAGDTGVLFTGVAVDSDVDVDLFKVNLSGGDRARIVVTPTTTGGVLYSTLRVYDATGKLVQSDVSNTPTLDYLAPSSGSYYIAVMGYGDIQFDPITGVVTQSSNYTGGYTLGVTRTAVGSTTLTGITATLDSGTAARPGVTAANNGATITLTGVGLTINDNVVFKAVDYYYNSYYDYTVSAKSVAADGKSLTVVVPDAAVTGTVRLYREQSGLLLQVVPIVTEVTASSGFRNGVVTVTGKGLAGFTNGGSVVNFGGTTGANNNSNYYYYSNNTYLYAGVASSAPTGPLTVTTAGGTSVAFDRTFTGLSTTTATANQVITVTGTNLSASTSIVFRARDSYAEYFVVVGPNSVATDKKSMQVTVPYYAVTGLVEVVGDRLSRTELLTIT